MKQSTYTLIKWLLLVTYSFFVFLYLKRIIQPELIYHVQQPPFLLDWDFFAIFLKYPGGISKYIANFLTQFFFYRWAGPFVILAVGFLIMLSGYFICRAIDESEYSYSLIFIPFILLLALVNNYYFLFVVVIRILFVFLAIGLLSFLIKKRINYIITFSVLSLIIYYLAGSGPLLLFYVTAIILLPFKKFGIKFCFFFLLFAGFYTFLIDYISYKYIFNISSENTYFSFLPDIDIIMDAFMNYRPDVLFYLFCYSLPVIGLIFLLKNTVFIRFFKEKSNIPSGQVTLKTTIFALLVFVIIAVVSFLLPAITFDKHKKNIVLTDYYCYNEKWKDVIDVALSDPEYDIFINFHYNRAIDNYGEFPDLFFKYPQYRIMALFPDRIGKPGLSHIISDYYFDMGYISISQQWAYAALAIMPYNPRVLKRVVITNLIYGNYKASQSFLKVLSKNFVSKDFVNHYMPYTTDTNRIARDKLLMEKRLLMPRNKVISDDLRIRFEVLLEQNKQNKRAYDHLQMCHLLAGDLATFMKNVPESYKFYNPLPETYEQAIIMYVYMTDSKNLSRLNVSKSSRETFAGFLETLKACNNDKDKARTMLSSYSDTYLYHATFNSPLKAVVKTNERKDY
jgi:hypothetical protein